MDKIKFNFDKYNPTRGGKFIPSPKWVQNKKACINIQNEDNKCFKYSIQCGICKVYEKDHPNRFYHYKNLNDELNWTNVNFPSSNIDIDTFEEKMTEKWQSMFISLIPKMTNSQYFCIEKQRFKEQLIKSVF